MNRRTFNKSLGAIAGALVLGQTYGQPVSLKPEDRLTMSTVNFRERFVQTKSTDESFNKAPLSLEQIPEYFRDRFGLSKVEFWSKHFESLSPSYLKDLKRTLQKAKSKLVNIQFDEDYQIGSPDESVRRKSMEMSMSWLEAASFLGSGAFRVNPNKGEVEHVISSLKIIRDECRKKKMVLMVENHFGIEMDPDVHLRIVREVGGIYTLPDYGNYNNDVRYDALKKIMPLAYQVSAKTMAFDSDMNHLSYDFDKCMQIAVDSGFKGIYSVEQWSREPVTVSDEAIADWMITRIKKYL